MENPPVWRGKTIEKCMSTISKIVSIMDLHGYIQKVRDAKGEGKLESCQNEHNELICLFSTMLK